LANSQTKSNNKKSKTKQERRMKDFRELKVWQKSHELTLLMYRMTESFPKTELFGLTSQIRRCSASVPANIAEGCGRLGNSELHRFLQMACGSASELEYHLLLGKDLGYISSRDHLNAHKQLIENEANACCPYQQSRIRTEAIAARLANC
jgi:four helix bundle protein